MSSMKNSLSKIADRLQGATDWEQTDGGQTSSEEKNDYSERIFYNHRPYFLAGYLLLALCIATVSDRFFLLNIIIGLLTINFLLIPGFSLRNILLLHRRDLLLLEEGKPGKDQQDSNVQAETEPGSISQEENWDMDDADIQGNEIPSSGVTFQEDPNPLTERKGIFFSVLDLEMERYMGVFIFGNILLFGSILAGRGEWGGAAALALAGLIIIGASLVDRFLYGIPLYPVYQDLLSSGKVFDPQVNKLVPAGYWFEHHKKLPEEKIISSDTKMLTNWKPHSYVLTDHGIYLEERKGLMAGKKFLYVPLLTIKGLKRTAPRINFWVAISAIVTFAWAFLIGTDDFLFIVFILIGCLELLFAFIKAGIQLNSRALNHTFSLSSKKNKIQYVDEKFNEIDNAFRARFNDKSSQKELQNYAWMEDLPSSPGLKELKKGVRGSSTGVILPIFFLSMAKLAKILEIESGGIELFGTIFAVIASVRILMALSNIWHYQKYLERPESGTMDLGILKLHWAEGLMALGYSIIAAGILWAVFQDMLPLAFLPGIVGGSFILTGRYYFSSTFRGIDYQEKSRHTKREDTNPTTEAWLRNKRMIPPTAAFVILLLLMAVTEPYFGESKAEVSGEYLDPSAGNNWKHLAEEDEDLLGLMGMFGLSIRIYEDDDADYPAVLSIVTLKFPVTPDEKDMLEEMRKYLAEYSDDEYITLEEPPVTGQGMTTQGFRYQYFIYNGTGQNGTSRFTVGEEMRIISAAFKVDSDKSFVIVVGICKVGNGRVVVDDSLPNPTDTRDFTNWNELKDELIPNIQVSS